MHMDIQPITLVGRHVRLEPLQSAHFEALLEIGVGHDIFRWFPYALETREQMETYLNGCLMMMEVGGLIPFTTIEQTTDRVIGQTCFLNIDIGNRRLEIGGTWLGVDWQRTPCNTEAKFLQLQHCFEDLQCVRVEFKTDAFNTRSRAALRRIGATEEGTLRSHMVCPGGRLRDSVYFSVLAPEWPATKARLEAMIARR
jgi:RimJ/RimL family protein N-acetyltransferase